MSLQFNERVSKEVWTYSSYSHFFELVWTNYTNYTSLLGYFHQFERQNSSASVDYP